MRTSGEKVRISDAEAEHVPSVSYSHVRSGLYSIYNIIVQCQLNKMVRQGLGLIFKIPMFPHAYKLKTNFNY